MFYLICAPKKRMPPLINRFNSSRYFLKAYLFGYFLKEKIVGLTLMEFPTFPSDDTWQPIRERAFVALFADLEISRYFFRITFKG